jgi:hypothetical protein
MGNWNPHSLGISPTLDGGPNILNHINFKFHARDALWCHSTCVFEMTYFIRELREIYACTYLDLTLLWSFGVKIGPNDVKSF